MVSVRQEEKANPAAQGRRLTASADEGFVVQYSPILASGAHKALGASLKRCCNPPFLYWAFKWVYEK